MEGDKSTKEINDKGFERWKYIRDFPLVIITGPCGMILLNWFSGRNETGCSWNIWVE
jgi:hypothetical protein